MNLPSRQKALLHWFQCNPGATTREALKGCPSAEQGDIRDLLQKGCLVRDKPGGKHARYIVSEAAERDAYKLFI